MLNKQEIERYEAKLRAEQVRLMREIEEESKPQDFGNDIDAGDSETDETEAFANQLAISQTLKDRVNEIQEALGRITAGNYGICTECGQPISQETLDLVPESSLCSGCKKKQI